MSLSIQVLGEPGRDNALMVRIDSGQALKRLLFDCGECCLTTLKFSEIIAIDQLFFSHLHMDHVAGFDTFFRCNFDRTAKPNRIWGPPGTSSIIQHRFQGYLWNLREELQPIDWEVAEVSEHQIHASRFVLSEAFDVCHNAGCRAYDRVIHVCDSFQVEAFTMDHRCPVLAYVVREKPRRNVDERRLAALGLRPGPWLRQLKESSSQPSSLTIDGKTYATDALSAELIVETAGEAIAYLTDFLLDCAAMERLVDGLHGCTTIVCEAQYRHEDLVLAQKNFHMTTSQAASLALRAKAKHLILFHLSDRYERPQWQAMLHEAQQIFPATRFADEWRLSEDST